MITREVKDADGNTIRKETVEAIETIIPPGYRARAAAKVMRELMDLGMDKAEAMNHPKTLQAARDAVDDGYEILPGCTQRSKLSVVIATPESQLEEQEPEEFFKDDEDAELDDAGAGGEAAEPAAAAEITPETQQAVYRRYLLSIVNQRRESFDDLDNDALLDMLNHPRLANLPVCSFETFAQSAIARMRQK